MPALTRTQRFLMYLIWISQDYFVKKLVNISPTIFKKSSEVGHIDWKFEIGMREFKPDLFFDNPHISIFWIDICISKEKGWYMYVMSFE